MSNTSVLNTPFSIGKIQIKNRYVMCAMGGLNLYHVDGTPAEDAYSFYIERAKGGVGLIVTRAIIVKPIGLDFNLYERPEIFEPMKKLTNEVHKYGAKIFMQLSAGAGRTLRSTVDKMENRGISKEKAFFAPSEGLPNFWYPEIQHRALSYEEIQDYILAFSKISKIAKEFDFDGVEIHALHEGYLLDQFAMSCTNNRKDKYGGSVEARFKFPCEIIEAIKRECGTDFPVIMRYSVASKMIGFNKGILPNIPYTEFGRTIEESIIGASLLEKSGCDAFDADNGAYDSWFWAHPPVYMPETCNISEVAILKQHSNIPVICAGKMDVEECEKYIDNNSCDAIGIARAVLVDPEYVNKVLNGNYNEIKPCIGCHIGCLGNLHFGGHIDCALNPKAFPKNSLPSNKRMVSDKAVAIIGAGISGMEAAIQLKKQGCRVKIYEKTDKLGGVFVAAAAFSFKERDKKLLEWYRYQMEKNNIKVCFNHFINKDNLDIIEEDIIICASGAEKNQISNLDVFGEYAIDFLRTDDNEKYCDNTVIIGGGLTGCEIAYEIAKNGYNVTIIEMQDSILNSHMCEANRQYLLCSIDHYDINVYTNSSNIKCSQKSITFELNGETVEIPYNKLILANGYHPKPILEGCPDTVNGKKIYYIGDSKKVGNLMTAIHTAHDVVDLIINEE